MQLPSGCPRKAVWLAALVLYAAVIIGFAAQAVYVWSIHSPGDCYLSLQPGCSTDTFVFFGSETAGTVTTLLTVSISVALPAGWLAYQVRFRLPALLGACRELLDERGARGAAMAGGRWLWLSLRTHRSGSPCDPDARRVRHEFEQQRLRRAKGFANKTVPLLVVLLLHSVYNQFLRVWLDQSFETALSWTYFSTKECVPIAFAAGFVIVFDLDPSWLTPGTLDYTNIMCSSMWGWRLCILPVMHYQYEKYWMIVGRIMQASLCGNVGLTIFLNIAILAIDLANMVYRPEVNMPAEVLWCIYREVFVVSLVCGLSWAWDCMQWAEAEGVVQMQRSDHSLALAEKVLSCMCDAVPRLTADLRLARQCPSLSTLLLRDGPIAPGVKFTDLISSEDAERLCSCLARAPPKRPSEEGAGSAGGRGAKVQQAIAPDSFAGLCHVRLRGANNFHLPVSVFYGCACEVDGQPTFLLGIREDCGEGAAPAAAAAGMPSMSSSTARALAALPEDSPAEADRPNSVAWSSFSGRSGNQNDEELLEVWTDAASGDLQVLSCSHGFALLGGTSGPCGDLSEWLSDSHTVKIGAMLRSRPGVHERVRLRPPVGGTYTCEVSVCSGRGLPPQLEASLAPSCSPLLLVFRVKSFSGRRREPGGQPHLDGRHSANVQGATLKDYASQDLDIVFTMQIEEGMEIGSILKGDGALVSQLREHRRLQDWLVDPAEFICSLVSALKSSNAGASRGARRQGVGTFTFKAAAESSPPLTGFDAHVSLLSFSVDERVAFPILLGLEQVRKLQNDVAPAEVDAEAALEQLYHAQLGAVSQSLASSTQVEPQLIGSASTHAL